MMMGVRRGQVLSFVVATSLALLLEHGSGEELQGSSCDMTLFLSQRSEWESADDACNKKLSFELWTFMRAEGSAQSADAQLVRENCFKLDEVGLVELITPKGFTMSESLEDAPGEVLSETEHATTYKGATAISFEAFCEDDNISRVTRVKAVLEARQTPQRLRRSRRLQTSTSEAGQAHQVAELIAGLQELGCTRTTGEDQTVCVLSDSFDDLGNAADLEASGDLPPVDVVKEGPPGSSDEGSAMLELMYDIAPGSNYKFNTAFDGEQTFADDIGTLVSEEGCDVVVDDVGYNVEPAFRDGVVADAVDDAVDAGSIYFSSAGNSYTGYRFSSDFECTDTAFDSLLDGATFGGCDAGFPTHVFRPELEGIYKYFWRFESFSSEEFSLYWDAAINTDQDVQIVIWAESLWTDLVYLFSVHDNFSGGYAVEQADFTPIIDSFSWIYNMQVIRLGSEDWNADFLLKSDAGIGGSTDGSMYGHACASSCVAVAAINWAEGSGSGGAFEDPETSPVEGFSSRGPCIVNGETRIKPTTTAADGLATSTPGFEEFFGTSAAAPVAGAIATIVRAACFPTEVGYAEIMEMLTNYDYTIDCTSDADGAAETWGTEAGHGIISASQMLAWVEANCGEACPGASQTTPAPVTPAPVDETPAPVDVTPAPVDETPAPVDVTPAPVDETPAPVDETPAPVDETPAPVDETPAPVDVTPAPVDETPAPVDVTPAPVDVTPAPVDETPAPVDVTPAPVDETPAPVDVTPAPVDETPAPVDVTPAPVDETPAPADETPAPVDETPAPVDVTPAPMDETPAPVDVTPAPVDETPAPVDVTIAPVDETPAPVDETPAPVDVTPAPVDVTPAPVDVTPAPVDETPAPVDETPAPVEETPAPVDKTPAPVDETPAPVDSTPAPVDETPAPVYETPAPATDPTQPGYVGCFADERDDRVLTAKWTSSAMTPLVCAIYCRRESATYAYYATQYGRECWCQESHIDLRHGAGTCDYNCSGDEGTVCGGLDSFSLYDLAEAPLPSSPTDNNYVGCFADDRHDRVLGAKTSSSSMTSEACAAHCTQESSRNLYYATQYGEQCWCAAEVDLRHGESTCDYACTGDAGTTCGGFDAFDLFELDLPSPPTEDFYLGCFADDKGDRVLEDKMSASDMSLEVCEEHCTARNKPFFSLQYGQECWCGGCELLAEGPGKYNRHGTGSCDTYPCSGDAHRQCGGLDAFSLYYRGTCA